MKIFLITLFVCLTSWAIISTNTSLLQAQEIGIESAKPYIECASTDGKVFLIAEIAGFKNEEITNYKLRFEMEPLYSDKTLKNATLTTHYFTSAASGTTKKEYVFKADNKKCKINLFHKGAIRREKLVITSSDLKHATGTFSFREGKGQYKQDFSFDLTCEFKSYD